MITDSLGDRMKGHESIPRISLIKRMPVCIRLDGKAFHTFAKWAIKPFDAKLSLWMETTTALLVDNIQGCVMGYTQSDEISLLLRDYDTFETQGWFQYDLQKMVSIAASMATAYFNSVNDTGKLAFFDARAWNLVKEEVCNAFWWRQQDCIRNSIQSLGQYHIGHKKIQGKNNLTVLEMLAEKGIDFNLQPKRFTHGIAYHHDIGFDYELPKFKDNRAYIERHVYLPPVEA
jgi:tRNA(His) guanylyltransferase